MTKAIVQTSEDVAVVAPEKSVCLNNRRIPAVDTEKVQAVCKPEDIKGHIEGTKGAAPNNGKAPIAVKGPDESREFAEFRALALSRATSQDQAQLLSGALTQLMYKQVNGVPALMQRDSHGVTLLENLKKLLANEKQTLPYGREAELLLSLAGEIANPNAEINQGRFATCVTTVANLRLARDLPAEYARIVVGLAVKGEVELHNGNKISFNPASVTEYYLRNRSLSESLFQTSVGDMVKAYSSGLYRGQAEQVYEAIFGVAFERIDAAEKSRLLATAKDITNRNGIVMASLRWDANGLHQNHALAIEGVREEVRDGVKESYVYFRNPWGKLYKNPKGVGAEPVPGEEQLFRMKQSEFEERVNYILANTAGAQFGVTAGADDPETQILTVLPNLDLDPLFENAPKEVNKKKRFYDLEEEENQKPHMKIRKPVMPAAEQ